VSLRTSARPQGIRQALEANGLSGRAEAIGGDFFVDVPEGDIYLLKQILHDWNDDQCRTILANCARRLVLLEASGLNFERMLPTHSPFQIIEASRNSDPMCERSVRGCTTGSCEWPTSAR
jgi:hypothetical protein